MADEAKPVAIMAEAVEPMRPGRGYPEPYHQVMQGRVRRVLGDLFGLTNFGVNLTRLAPNGMSALRHAHSREDEFIYVLEGEPVLVTSAAETPLRPGMCAGFKAGSGDAHHLVNRTEAEAVYLEIGTRDAGDTVIYPDADLGRALGADGRRIFVHRDGRPY